MSDHGQNPYGQNAPQQLPQYPGYGHPYAAAYGGPVPVPPRNGMGTAGLVCGIVGLVLSFMWPFWFFAFVLAVLAIVFGAVGRSRAKKGQATNRGVATSGLVLGIVAVVLLFAWIGLVAAGVGMSA
ncbi:DUF4190 domain-containing protein [Streptomyces gamaensis]|uniref:DUF4190 domain-containing protein n=1 Tax=Streptomyces gamaensis TaxID=1763542 RepID=A0ABW0Z0E4_9ACTN